MPLYRIWKQCPNVIHICLKSAVFSCYFCKKINRKMKKIVVIVCLLLVCSLTTQARKIIFYSTGDHVSKVMDLPNDENFEVLTDDGKSYHANLGILHKQFSLFWIPVFNYDTEKYVLYTDTKIDGYDYTYAELDTSEIKTLQKVYGYKIPDTPKLPFWDRIGGKLVWLAIIIALIVYRYKQKDEENIDTTSTQQEEIS